MKNNARSEEAGAFYVQRGFPVLQNRTYETREEALNCATGDIILVQDEETGIVHNAAFDPSSVEYDSSYQNEQAHSGAFKRHPRVFSWKCWKAGDSRSPASTRPTRDEIPASANAISTRTAAYMPMDIH